MMEVDQEPRDFDDLKMSYDDGGECLDEVCKERD